MVDSARRLYLVRHGATAANRDGRYIGWDEHPLCAEGKAQAEQVAAYLSGLRPTALVSSDLGRCVETAERIARATGLEPVMDSRLRELNFGRFSGLTFAEIARAWPDELKAWLDDPERAAPPGGESMAAFRRRVLAAIPQGDGAVVVTHGGVIRAVVAHLTGRAFWSWAPTPGSVTVVQWDGVRALEPHLWRPDSGGR